MKKTLKVFAAGALLATFASAASIDAGAAKVNVVGYKTAAKTAVPMTFLDAKFNFAKTDGSISDILTGATSTVTLASADTIKNPLRDKNMRDKLFAKFSSPTAQAKINSVEGDDSKGVLKTTVSLNGQSKDVEMKYEVSAGKLVATGIINLEKDFNAKAAFDEFRNDKVIQGLHAKQTSPEVQIGFEVPVK